VAERLQKYLARSGVASRRAAEQLMLARRVRVNGRVVDRLGSTVEPNRDRVEVDGRVVAGPEPFRYVALHKPSGVLSTAADPRGRPTVVDLVGSDARLYPVGRLDYDSEGLIILTNDGDLALRLTHPRHSVEKEYRVLIRGHPGEEELNRLRDGVCLDGIMTAPAAVDVLPSSEDARWLRIVLHEGRNRQIRRMTEAVGLRVRRLIRTRIGPLRLGRLAPGRWRDLGPAEVAALRAATR
jgi:23S rRNA pseudouridine2605 synthase